MLSIITQLQFEINGKLHNRLLNFRQSKYAKLLALAKKRNHKAAPTVPYSITFFPLRCILSTTVISEQSSLPSVVILRPLQSAVTSETRARIVLCGWVCSEVGHTWKSLRSWIRYRLITNTSLLLELNYTGFSIIYMKLT